MLYGLYPWRPRYRLMPAGYRGVVQEMASVLDISGSLGRRARTLSGGQRRRLEIVRALMHRPRGPVHPGRLPPGPRAATGCAAAAT